MTADDTPAVPDTEAEREALAFLRPYDRAPGDLDAWLRESGHARDHAATVVRAALARDVPAGCDLTAQAGDDTAPSSGAHVIQTRGFPDGFVPPSASLDHPAGDTAPDDLTERTRDAIRRHNEPAKRAAQDAALAQPYLSELVRLRSEVAALRDAGNALADGFERFAGLGIHDYEERALIGAWRSAAGEARDVPAPTDEPVTEARIRELYEGKYPLSADTEDDLTEIMASLDVLRTLGLSVVPDRAGNDEPRPGSLVDAAGACVQCGHLATSHRPETGECTKCRGQFACYAPGIRAGGGVTAGQHDDDPLAHIRPGHSAAGLGPTEHDDPICGSEHDDGTYTLTCTREPEHPGQHIAAGMYVVEAVWAPAVDTAALAAVADLAREAIREREVVNRPGTTASGDEIWEAAGAASLAESILAALAVDNAAPDPLRDAAPTTAEVRAWEVAQYGDNGPERYGLKVAEEAGEVAGAVLKRAAGVVKPGRETHAHWTAHLYDEIADLVISLHALAGHENVDLDRLVGARWHGDVSHRRSGQAPAQPDQQDGDGR